MSENNAATPMEIQIYEKRIGLLKWNFEELNKALDANLAKYKGVVYSADQIVLAKKDRAALNGFKKAVNDRKIQLKKEFCAPYDEFADQVKQLIGKVDEVSSEIDAQVKAFEEAEKEAKRKEMEQFWFDIKPDKELIPFEQIFDEKWLNKSVSTKQWQQALTDIATKVRDELHMIAVDTISDNAKMQWMISEYLRTLDYKGTRDAWDRKVEQEARQAELEARLKEQQAIREAELAEQKKRLQEAQNAPQEAVPESAVEQFETETIYVRDFHVELTRNQMIALDRFLKENGIRITVNQETKSSYERRVQK